jgi:CRISPR-associated protein Csx16
MTTFFISRHPGALDWAAEEGLAVDARLAHLDPETIQPGDVVIGTLPIHLAARVCERGGRYLHLSLELPPEQRGRELSAADLRRCGARLEEYRVTRLVVSG